MSYSFSIRAASKTAAKEAFAAKFDETVVAPQPVHACDRAAVLANANAAIDLLAEDDAKDVAVTCNGYVSWSKGTTPETAEFSTASISASASHANRE